MHSAKKQKVTSFYSKSLPRPIVLLDSEDKPIRDRVDAPEPVTGALLEWAKKAPLNKGGSKPIFKGAPAACLTAFGAMVQDKRKELLEGEMRECYKAEPKSLQADAKSMAVKEWKLLDEEHRSGYQERAAADQIRWEKEVEQYESKYPHYRSYLAQKHVKKLNDKGIIDIQLSQLGIKKPFTARHYYIKEQVEKRLKEDDSMAGEIADLFEEISNAKRKAWLDMADSGRRKYERLADQDRKRFEDQLQAHPKLAAMVAAYEEKQQELRTLKKGKGTAKSSKGTKKRRHQEDMHASDDEGADDALEMDVDKQAQPAEQREPLTEIGQVDNPDAGNTAEIQAVQSAPEADEPVSDTDDDEDDGDFGGDLLETVQETQNDEEEQALTGSQASTLKKGLGMQKFGSFIAGLFTAKKPANRSSGQEQPSQSSAAAAAAPVASMPAAEQEGDDMPPIQNTLDSQPSASAGEETATGTDAKEEDKAVTTNPTPAPAGPAATPQLPQKSLVATLNEVAEESPVLPQAVGTEGGSIAFVTAPGLAQGIQTTAEAAGARSPAGKAGLLGTKATTSLRENTGKPEVDSSAEQQADQVPAKTRASRAAKSAASDKIAGSAVTNSAKKRASSASCPSAEKKKVAGAIMAESNDKENDQSAPLTGGGQEASHMAVKEPHSRVAEAQGVKGGTPGASNRNKRAGPDKRDALIGRCVKKDFETDDGLKTYTGWVIGKHPSKKWYAVQYEDGDKEEFVASELTKGGKKSMLQPPGVEDKSDYEELDRLYVQAQTEWAAEEAEEKTAGNTGRK